MSYSKRHRLQSHDFSVAETLPSNVSITNKLFSQPLPGVCHGKRYRQENFEFLQFLIVFLTFWRERKSLSSNTTRFTKNCSAKSTKQGRRNYMDVPLKGKYKNAKIFVRVFPSATISRDLVKLCDDKKTIYCRCLQDFEKGTDPNKQNYWNFSTDGVLYNCSQKDVYAKVMDGTIEK